MKAVPFIIQEVYLCGIDTELGLTIPRICCPDDALAHQTIIAKPTTTTTTPTSTSGTPTTTTTTSSTTTSTGSHYEDHPGSKLISNPDTCGRSFVMSDVGPRLIERRHIANVLFRNEL